MQDCIFCKIAYKEISSRIVWEDEYIVAFWDIQPAARVHILVVPKRHISSLKDLCDEDENLAGHIMCAIPKIARELNLDHFKIECNTGASSGQTVFHLHLHLMQK